ncbi:MAG: hypothetical protein NTW87_24640 [Planctomycetota bacterium]|nr:hypothetical protein [Planctomycetota bacterium]
MARARKRYKPEIKAKIIEAAMAARAAGKPWKEAHVAARQAGYRGNVDALMQMMAKRKAKRAAPAPAKKRGRPPKAKAPAPTVTGLDPVASQYLVSAIDKAVAELQRLRQQYAR